VAAYSVTLERIADDDVGVAGPEPLHVRAPRSLTSVPMLRRRARAWLRTTDVDEDTAEAVLLATGEAVSNAVEHAYPPDAEGVVDLTMTSGPGPAGLQVSVVDGGRWRPAPSDTGFRGRGLAMIRALADLAEITTGSHGTSVRLTWGPPSPARPGGQSNR
jgi:two-component sensor histidine kinase